MVLYVCVSLCQWGKQPQTPNQNQSSTSLPPPRPATWPRLYIDVAEELRDFTRGVVQLSHTLHEFQPHPKKKAEERDGNTNYSSSIYVYVHV